MSSKQNIEDIFHEGLEDFQIKPSGKVWTSVNKQMTGPRLEASCRNAFDGFKVDPSKLIWRRVAAAVWFQKFIHFTPFSFNIYYLAIITTAIIGAVITVNNVPNLEFKHFDENINKTQNLDILYADDFDANSVFKLPQFKNSYIKVEDLVVDGTNQVNGDADKISEENMQLFSANKELNKGTNKKIDRDDLADDKGSNNFMIQLVKEESDEKSAQLNDKDLAKENSDKNFTQKQVVMVSTDLQEKYGFNDKTIPARLYVKNSFKLFYSPQWYEIADIVFASIPKYDEIVKDTIGYNYLGEPVVVDQSWFEVGAFYSPYKYGTNSTLKNDELASNYEIYKNGIRPTFSWGAGLSISYNFNRFRVESGLSYLSLNESFDQMVKSYEAQTVYSYDYFTNTYWDIDTTMILDLDEYLQGNIVYIPFIDSLAVNFEDSLMISSVDSVLVNNKLSATSNVKYLEMPLIGGYEFTYGQFAITPKAGLICGLLTYIGGTGYSVIDGEIVAMESLSLNKINFDYYGAINLQYRIGEHLSIFAEPHIRGAINSSFKESYPIDSRSIKYGVRTGISYRF